MFKVFFALLLVLFISASIFAFYLYRTNTSSIFDPVLESLNFKKPTPPVSWGFLPYWSLSKFDPKYLDQFTHLAYFSLTLNPDGTIQKLVNPREQEPGWTNLNKSSTNDIFVSAKNAGVTLSLTIFSGTSDDISTITENYQTSAQNTAADLLPLIEKFGFTDINIDLEDPIETPENVRVNFTKYVATLRKLIKAKYPNTTFSLDYISISTVRPRLTDLPDLNHYIDRFIVMAYDYHSPNSIVAGPVAPASGSGELRAFDTTVAVNSALTQVPAYKLVLGIPVYGYAWNTISNVPGSATIPRTGHTLTDSAIAKLLESCADCLEGWDEVAQESYIIRPQGELFEQIYYGSKRSLDNKLQNIQTNKLGGVAIWALGYEAPDTLDSLTNYKTSITNIRN